VRRRRWVRLMMRPGSVAAKAGEADAASAAENETSSGHDRTGVDKSSQGGLEDLVLEPEFIWKGDDEDWQRCFQAMKKAGRDSAILDLWRTWIEYGQKQRNTTAEDHHNDHGSTSSRSPFDDSNQPQTLDHVATVLKSHSETILNLFIFPVSRVEFLRLVGKAFNGSLSQDNLLPSFSNVDFWSELRTLVPNTVML